MPDTAIAPSRAPVVRRAAPPVSRLQTLDASRGLAMLFVCLAHVAESVALVSGPSRLLGRAVRVSMVASPTFMLISGMLLGYMATQGEARLRRFSDKLRERGLFLLTIGHALMLPPFEHMADRPSDFWRFLLITDAIGFSLLVGPSVVRRLGARARAWLAVGLLALPWAIILLVPPAQSRFWFFLRTTLIGGHQRDWWLYSFPLVPWFAVYLAGTVLGERLAAARAARGSAAETRQLASWSAVGMIGTALVALLRRSLRLLFPGAIPLHHVLAHLGSPFQKHPPGPGYVLGYGTLGLAMMAGLSWSVEHGHLPRAIAALAKLGQASLAIFVLQFYLFYTAVFAIGPAIRHFWVLYLLAGYGVLLLAAHLWLRAGGNRLLRVPGFRRLTAGPQRS